MFAGRGSSVANRVPGSSVGFVSSKAATPCAFVPWRRRNSPGDIRSIGICWIFASARISSEDVRHPSKRFDAPEHVLAGLPGRNSFRSQNSQWTHQRYCHCCNPFSTSDETQSFASRGFDVQSCQREVGLQLGSHLYAIRGDFRYFHHKRNVRSKQRQSSFGDHLTNLLQHDKAG